MRSDIKERQIPFNGDMVRATLEDRKTHTRRPVKPQPQESYSEHFSKGGEKHRESFGWNWKPSFKWPHIECPSKMTEFSPYGKVGDRLWVKETFVHIKDSFDGLGDCIYYRATQSKKSEDFMKKYKLKWTPSIYMPRWASRITLEITDIQVERIQNISEKDAVKEGIESEHPAPSFAHVYKDYITGRFDLDARGSFQTLWEYLCPGSWELNPWVWVIEFKRVDESTPAMAGKE